MQNQSSTNSKSGLTYRSEFIKNPPMLLKQFHDDDILAFLDLGMEEHYKQDEVVISESKWVDSAYLIVNGKVSIWKDNMQTVVLSSGEFLGETFLFSRNRRMAKVVAESDNLMLLRFERYDVLEFFRKKPEKLFNIFTKNIIEIQQSKIDNMNMQLVVLKKRLLQNKI